jgi:hypothetical protein
VKAKTKLTEIKGKHGVEFEKRARLRDQLEKK